MTFLKALTLHFKSFTFRRSPEHLPHDERGPRKSPPLLSAQGYLGSLSHLPTCLLPLLKVIMPRGQKSKLRTRERRRQAQVEPQNLVGAQAIVGVGEEFPSSFSSCKAIS